MQGSPRLWPDVEERDQEGWKGAWRTEGGDGNWGKKTPDVKKVAQGL